MYYTYQVSIESGNATRWLCGPLALGMKLRMVSEAATRCWSEGDAPKATVQHVPAMSGARMTREQAASRTAGMRWALLALSEDCARHGYLTLGAGLAAAAEELTRFLVKNAEL